MGKEKTCIWTPAHLEEIDRVFPEMLTYESTNDLLVNLGKRMVVQYIKDKVTRGVSDSTRNKSPGYRRDN